MSTTTAPKTPQSALEAARARVAAEQEKLAKLEARASLAERFAAEEITLEQVAEAMGVSTESARAALVSLGAITPRRRTITFAEEATAKTLLAAGKTTREVADEIGVVETIIRKIARDNNLLRRSTRRSPEKMAELAKLEEQVRGVYGAGFAALGEALRKWRADQASEAAGEPGADDLQPISAALSEATIDLGSEELPPPVAPPPAAVPVNEPVGLSPEDEAKMAEPDAQPEGDIADWN
jgi:transcriptional regulator with XRE-family HTH domain